MKHGSIGETHLFALGRLKEHSSVRSSEKKVEQKRDCFFESEIPPEVLRHKFSFAGEFKKKNG